MERTITVRGTLENISEAEQKISGKLRQCWENDMVNAVSVYFAVFFLEINGDERKSSRFLR